MYKHYKRYGQVNILDYVKKSQIQNKKEKRKKKGPSAATGPSINHVAYYQPCKMGKTLDYLWKYYTPKKKTKKDQFWSRPAVVRPRFQYN